MSFNETKAVAELLVKKINEKLKRKLPSEFPPVEEIELEKDNKESDNNK